MRLAVVLAALVSVSVAVLALTDKREAVPPQDHICAKLGQTLFSLIDVSDETRVYALGLSREQYAVFQLSAALPRCARAVLDIERRIPRAVPYTLPLFVEEKTRRCVQLSTLGTYARILGVQVYPGKHGGEIRNAFDACGWGVIADMLRDGVTHDI